MSPLKDRPKLITSCSAEEGCSCRGSCLTAKKHGVKSCTSARDPGKLAASPPGIQLQQILTEVLSWKQKRGWREEPRRKRGQRGSPRGHTSSTQLQHSFPVCPHTHKIAAPADMSMELKLATKTSCQPPKAGTPADPWVTPLSGSFPLLASCSISSRAAELPPSLVQAVAVKCREAKREKGFQQFA